MTAMLSQVFAFLAPHSCLGCGQEGTLLCRECCPTAVKYLPARCYKCRIPNPLNAVCVQCRINSSLGHVWIISDYAGLLRTVFQRYKFERARDMAGVLAEIISNAVPPLPKGTIISFVPTATSHVRERGFDQAKELAKAFARQQNLQLYPLLYRLGQHHQVGADRATRLEQMQNVFRPRYPEVIKNSTIALVDDILTTGATLESAAYTLRKAGARSVDALVLAQKQ